MSNLKLLVTLLLLLINNFAIAALPDVLAQHYSPAVILPHYINIKAPKIAEESSQVSISVESIQLSEKESYVTDISFYLSHDPKTAVAQYNLTPTTLAEGLKVRLRMSYGKNILYSVARLSDGSVISGEATIKVVRACNGGS